MNDEKGVDEPRGLDWPTLRDKSGTELTDYCVDLLRSLAKQTGILGDVFVDSQLRFNNPVSLKRLVNLIDETEWTTLGVDIKAQAYEGLLEETGGTLDRDVANPRFGEHPSRNQKINPSSEETAFQELSLVWKRATHGNDRT